MTGRRLHAAVFVAAACVLTYAVPAWAHDTGVRRADAAWGPRAASAPQSCPGRAIQPDQVITGDFGTDLQGSYVMLPFDVPQGTTAVRVKDCFDHPEAPVTTPAFSARHTFDLGLLRPREDRSRTWGVPEFRGWGGSSHPDVTVSAEGFSTEEQYVAKPRVETPGNR